MGSDQKKPPDIPETDTPAKTASDQEIEKIKAQQPVKVALIGVVGTIFGAVATGIVAWATKSAPPPDSHPTASAPAVRQYQLYINSWHHQGLESSSRVRFVARVDGVAYGFPTRENARSPLEPPEKNEFFPLRIGPPDKDTFTVEFVMYQEIGSQVRTFGGQGSPSQFRANEPREYRLTPSDGAGPGSPTVTISFEIRPF
jgi:hypothetical protein